MFRLCDFRYTTTSIAGDMNMILEKISCVMDIEKANEYIKAGILSNTQKQANTWNTLEAYMSYALVLECLGHNEEACKYYKKAMTNEDSNEVYVALITVILANIKDKMAQYDKALILFKESLQLISVENILVQASGNFLHVLTLIICKSYNYPEEQLAEQSFALIKEIFKKPNTRTVDILEYLAVSLPIQNKENKMLLELLLSVIEKEDLRSAFVMCKLATIFKEEQNFQEALCIINKAVVLMKKFRGKDSHDLAEFLYIKAGILTSIGKAEEALTMLQEQLVKEQKYYGMDHFNTTHTLQAISSCLFDLKRYKEAEKYCQKALSMQIKILGPNHVNTVKLWLALAQIHEETEKYTESLSLETPCDNTIDMSQLQIHKEKCLEQGFYGSVYCGTYGKLPVAIKTIKNLMTKNEKQQFKNEVKTLM